MKPYIHFNQKNHRGPGKVVENLLKGLKEAHITIAKTPGQAKNYGCLQHPGGMLHYLPKNTLMGPNIFVLPNEEPVLVRQMKNFIVPSEWVKKLYTKFPEMKEKNIQVWSVGIDTDEWQPSLEQEKDLDCFLYIKNRSESDVQHALSLCKELNLNVETITYGAYQENDLKKLCERSKFAILLTDTESQGIAYMQILSMNVPCFVFNKTVWNYQNNFGMYQFSATSVPYFDDSCGHVTVINKENLKELQSFVENIKSYQPRNYILNNHTLKHSAEKYIEILKNIEVF